jgi:hypothetical protein
VLDEDAIPRLGWGILKLHPLILLAAVCGIASSRSSTATARSCASS